MIVDGLWHCSDPKRCSDLIASLFHLPQGGRIRPFKNGLYSLSHGYTVPEESIESMTNWASPSEMGLRKAMLSMKGMRTAA